MRRFDTINFKEEVTAGKMVTLFHGAIVSAAWDFHKEYVTG